ncbi:MAG: gamma-glutamylcyclotransferase family protein [Planctomycetota bacterium]
MHVVFAYGCLMDPAVMARVCPHARPDAPPDDPAAAAAQLPGHRLAFPIPTDPEWQSPIASLTPDPAATAQGVLWSLDDVSLAALDDYEDTDLGIYTRRPLRVARLRSSPTPSPPRPESLTAWVYLANPTPHPDAPASLHPSPDYRAALLRGADHFRLTLAYRDTLAALPTTQDANPT